MAFGVVTTAAVVVAEQEGPAIGSEARKGLMLPLDCCSNCTTSEVDPALNTVREPDAQVMVSPFTKAVPLFNATVIYGRVVPITTPVAPDVPPVTVSPLFGNAEKTPLNCRNCTLPLEMIRPTAPLVPPTTASPIVRLPVAAVIVRVCAGGNGSTTVAFMVELSTRLPSRIWRPA
jgi:hypothetical protein